MDPLDHQIPHETVQAEIRGSVDLCEFDSRPVAVNPSHLSEIDGKRFMAIRQKQPERDAALWRHGSVGLYRTTHSRQIDDDAFSDHREHAIHCWVADRQTVEPTMVGSDGFHDRQESNRFPSPSNIPRKGGRGRSRRLAAHAGRFHIGAERRRRGRRFSGVGSTDAGSSEFSLLLATCLLYESAELDQLSDLLDDNLGLVEVDKVTASICKDLAAVGGEFQQIGLEIEPHMTES